MFSPLVVAILAASAVVTSFVSGILGMAGGMILMGVLLALMPVGTAMVLHGITQLAANLWRALLWRRAVVWRVFRGYVYGGLAAIAVFVVLQVVVSKPVALVAMGLTPFVSLVLPESLHLNVERRGHAFVCGMVCSVLSLTAGISGPILDTFFVRSKMGRQSVVATKAMTQSFSHLSKIGYFGGLVATGNDLDPRIGAMMIAFAIVGTTLSRRVLERMDDKSFRFWTRWTVMTLGGFYVLDGIYLLVRG